jgi:hypothetical protein
MMPDIMHADLTEFRLLQHPREHMADIPLLVRRALARQKHPERNVRPFLSQRIR